MAVCGKRPLLMARTSPKITCPLAWLGGVTNYLSQFRGGKKLHAFPQPFLQPQEIIRKRCYGAASLAIMLGMRPCGVDMHPQEREFNVNPIYVCVPCSLNYVFVDGPQQQPLRPYPSWREAFVTDTMTTCPGNSTVVSAFRVAVDDSDRLWVVDNGVTDMASGVRQIANPAVLVFDLKTDRLLHRYDFGNELRNTSVLTSIVVDDTCGCDNSTFAYITDMGSNAVIVFDLHYNEAWRVESPHFLFDPGSGVYRVGGVDFYWSDGVSSAALSNNKRDGSRDLYVQPTSSTKTFKISTDVMTNKHASEEEKRNAVQVVGDRGPNAQATACDLDRVHKIMFFTQLSRNGVSCWNMDKPLSPENTPLVISDCNLLEFPNDVKVDKEGILWILSDRQSRFLYSGMDFNQINFRVLAAPATDVVEGSACAPPSRASSLRNIFHRKKSK